MATAVVVALASGSGVLGPAARVLPPAVARLGVADTCAEAPLDVSYDVGFEPALGEYAVTGVRVGGLPDGCADRELWVALTAADGTTLADVRTETGPGGVRVGGPLVPAVRAAAVAGVAGVLRDGPAGAPQR